VAPQHIETAPSHRRIELNSLVSSEGLAALAIYRSSGLAKTLLELITFKNEKSAKSSAPREGHKMLLGRLSCERNSAANFKLAENGC